MRQPRYTGQFRKDVKLAEKRGKDMAKLRHVLRLLIDVEILPARLRDHSLKGEWSGWRDLHIEPDWLLLYRVVEDELQLARTGTHADLFKD